jgi:hypothetical protein
MTTYYVDGTSGNNGNAGTSVGSAKATWNGAEDIPLVPGDTVHVRSGTYRELLTVDVSGTSGNPITYIGDYDGSVFGGVGGVVRVTGSDNDQTATRTNCIAATSKNYRTFRGFTFDTCSSTVVNIASGTNWIVEDCYFGVHANGTGAINMDGAGQAAHTVRRCYLLQSSSGVSITFTHSSAVDNAAHTVENCVLIGSTNSAAISSVRVGGVTVRNSAVLCSTTGIRVANALTVGQVMTVNNCVLYGCQTALSATTTAEFVENYNNLFGNNAARTNVTTGANSNAYPPLFDTRWFFEMVGGGSMVTPFDLASYSQLVNVAGTSPTTADMRGTTVQGAQREWGGLEYLSTLDIVAGAGASGGMGGIFGSIVI